jgi:hypothetical protein
MTLISTILADAPTAFYEMQETSGTTAHDSSGNGFDATITGGVTLGQSGPTSDTGYKSMSYDGSTGYLAVPAGVSFNNATAFSVEFAFNQLIAGGGTARVVAESHTDATSKGFQCALNEGSNSGGLFDIGHAGTNEYANFWPGLYTLATWHHIVYVMDSGTNHLLVYLDGTLTSAGATFPGGTTVTNDSFNINIGRGPYNNDYYRGGLAMAALYNGVALSQARVTAHYAAFTAITPLYPTVSTVLTVRSGATAISARDGKSTIAGRDGKTTMIAR